MVPEGNLVAPKFFCLRIKVPPSHPRAQITRRFTDVVDRIEDLCFKDFERHTEHFGIAFDERPVEFIVAGVHAEEYEFKVEFVMALELLKELRHEHGVLTAGNADGDLVAGLHQFVFHDALGKRNPERLFEFPPVAKRLLDFRRAVFMDHLLAKPGAVSPF